MKKTFAGVLLFAFLLIALLMAGAPRVSRAQLNPTDAQGTVDAAVQQFFQQTKQAQSGGSDAGATATAAFQATVQSAFQRAVTATALAANPNGVLLATVNSGNNINVRGCPATTCGVVGSAPAGAQLPILLSENGWYLTTLANGTSGYVSAQLVTLPDGADLSKLPTLTPSPTPSPSATRTATLTRTPTATPTPNLSITQTLVALGKLAEPKGDGSYIVGVDIAIGHWKATGKSNTCQWERRDRNGNETDLLVDSQSLAGAIINVRRIDYELNVSGCGQLVYIEKDPKVLSDNADSPKGTGYYRVGVDIVPGRWKITGRGGDCYWARLDTSQHILDNHFGAAAGTIVVRASDYELLVDDCGYIELQTP